MALSQSEAFRRSVRDLTVLANRELAGILGRSGDPRDAQQLLGDILPELVREYGLAAGTLAADYYDELRDEQKVRGRFSAAVPDVPDPGADGLIRWALGKSSDGATFQELLLGGVQRRIANVSRSTVMRSARSDPHAKGWMRIGTGECDFCAMLVGRGAVYTSEKSVEFAAHDHCNCNYAPAFNERQIKAVRREFVPSAKRRSESTETADDARARDWIAAHL